MAIYNLGSINIDHFYQVDHLPKPGETLASQGYHVGLGGKGANQSIAAALAGAKVHHIGAVGADGGWCKSRLSDAGVNTDHIATIATATGHANICVDPEGENLIILYSGANADISEAQVKDALRGSGSGDHLLLQNETTLTYEAAQMARAAGVFVIYSAAPFDASRAIAMLPVIDLLAVNEVEAEQLSAALGTAVETIEVPHLVITRGAKGAIWLDRQAGAEHQAPAFRVDPVDTTGAGDCFIGNVVATLDQGQDVDTALRRASAASAIQVTREGTSSAMPRSDEVDDFLATRP
ncbi:ribokinase [Aliiroseovarius sp. S2029]|uniref:ribokinase n=1 Tax=Aliiroseovarius sp. S2029 TaxID=2936988 RepID=UPI0020BFC113|nr:ribokinase [Aliiroseovarius sp. S2029]